MLVRVVGGLVAKVALPWKFPVTIAEPSGSALMAVPISLVAFVAHGTVVAALAALAPSPRARAAARTTSARSARPRGVIRD